MGLSDSNEFKMSSWAVDNRYVIYLLVFMCVIGGVSAYLSMPRENFPEVKDTRIYVSVAYPGSTAEDVEDLIINPLEEKFKSLSNVDEIKSTSRENYGMVMLEFNEKIDVFEALNKVKDKVDKEVARDDWPVYNNAKVTPNVFDINISEEIPIVNVNIQGDYPVFTLKKYAEYLETEIEAVSQVKEVKIRGLEDFEVEVAVDIYKMTSAKVSFDDIINSLRSNNLTLSAGNLVVSGMRKTIRIPGEVKSPEELKTIAVKSDREAPVYLGDVAKIAFKQKQATSYSRANNSQVVMLDVKKNAGENMVDAIRSVHKVLDKAKADILPADIDVYLTNDKSIETINKVDNLINNVVFGVILVVGVLMFFMGLRNALFVGIAIPMSMLLSMIVLDAIGYTLNTMVLFAMVMGLGMLVDNGIVVTENIYRLFKEKKMSLIKATKQGVGEIAYPIIVSTATTLAAFVPLALWPGVMGRFMKILPITVSIVLISSLLVAFLMNSVFISRFMKAEEIKIPRKRLIKISLLSLCVGVCFFLLDWTVMGNLALILIIILWGYRYIFGPLSERFEKAFLLWSENFYRRFVSFALKGSNPLYFLGATLVLLILSFVLLGVATPKVEFFPDNKPNEITVYIEYPEGTDIEKTNSVTKTIERDVYKILSDKRYKHEGKNFLIESAVAQVGRGSNNVFLQGVSYAEMPHKGKITIKMAEYQYRRGEDTEELRLRIQKALKNRYAGVSISVEKNIIGPPRGYPINIEVRGDDYNRLLMYACKITQYINNHQISGIENLEIDVDKDRLSDDIIVDRKRAGELGVSVYQIGNQLRRSIFGEKVGVYKYKGDDYDVNVRFDEKLRYNTNDLYNQRINFRDRKGQLKEIPVVSLIKKISNPSFSAVKHIDNRRVITVYSPILAGYNAYEVVKNIKEVLKGLEVPDGVSYSFTGEMEEQGEQMAFLGKALVISMLLIMLLLVLQFNSFSKPLIILLAIVLSFIGVLLGLVIFQMSFVIIMTMIGVISLAGVVVNNAVVLLDYIQLLIGRFKSKNKLEEKELLSLEQLEEIIVEGSKSRLRPVLLTAITTILGLLPLATGLNIDFLGFLSNYDPDIYIGGDSVIFWGPLAWTVIFGLTFATFLTLVIVPVTYLLVTRIKMSRLKYR